MVNTLILIYLAVILVFIAVISSSSACRHEKSSFSIFRILQLWPGFVVFMFSSASITVYCIGTESGINAYIGLVSFLALISHFSLMAFFRIAYEEVSKDNDIDNRITIKQLVSFLMATSPVSVLNTIFYFYTHY